LSIFTFRDSTFRRWSLLALALSFTLYIGCLGEPESNEGTPDVDGGALELRDSEVSGSDTQVVPEANAAERCSGLPSPSVLHPWAWTDMDDVEHGFPDEIVSLDCDAAMFRSFSPAVWRETSRALIHGTIVSVDIPDCDRIAGKVCAGDRVKGLRMVIHVERSFGPFAPGPGAEAAIYVSSGQFTSWKRWPVWDSTEGVARWSDWWDESDSPRVPQVGGQVLISSLAWRVAEGSDDVLLQGFQFYSISSSGEVIPQRDRRAECSDRLEIDGQVPDTYGHIGALWQRIAEDELTDDERERMAGVDRTSPPLLRPSFQWVVCRD